MHKNEVKTKLKAKELQQECSVLGNEDFLN